MVWRQSTRGPDMVRRFQFDRAAPRKGRFTISMRQSTADVSNFSVILSLKESREDRYRLLRLCGKHGQHTNKLDPKRRSFKRKFHIHRITEQYQRSDKVEDDGEAQPTTKFDSVDSALEYLISDYGFRVEPSDADGQLLFGFGEGGRS